MKLERFRSFDGLMIRAIDNKELFKHCAGDISISSRKHRAICDLLMFHGIMSIQTTNHESV